MITLFTIAGTGHPGMAGGARLQPGPRDVDAMDRPLRREKLQVLAVADADLQADRIGPGDPEYVAEDLHASPAHAAR